jgi:hypothetical protein
MGNRFVALDTGFLISLAGDYDGMYQQVVDVLKITEGFDLLVSTTVIQELTSAAEHEQEDPDIQRLARVALESLNLWGFLAWELSERLMGKRDEIAEMLGVRQIIDGEFETPRRIVAEAAIHQCILLVTEREVLTAVNNLALGFALLRENVTDVAIKEPTLIIEIL